MSAKAERERQEGYYHVMERAYGASECVIRLPISVDESGAHARHKRGVMYSTLPLSTEHQSRLSKAVSEKLVIREGGPKMGLRRKHRTVNKDVFDFTSVAYQRRVRWLL